MSTQVQDPQPSRWTRNIRRSPRAKINMHVKVWRRLKGEKKLVPGYSRNISQDGIAIFIPAEIAVDEKVELQFTLPELSREITVHAIVRAVNKFQYGMEFTSLDSTMKRLLGALAVR
jgi:PilZ domain-containing protein